MCVCVVVKQVQLVLLLLSWFDLAEKAGTRALFWASTIFKNKLFFQCDHLIHRLIKLVIIHCCYSFSCYANCMHCSPSLSLYRGWLPVISSLCCSNFVYFYTFNTLKKLMASGSGRSGPSKDLLMGVISGLPIALQNQLLKTLKTPQGAVAKKTRQLTGCCL